MRATLSCASLLLIACGSAHSPPLEALEAGAMSLDGERIELRLRTANRLTMFARTQSITVDDLNGHRERLDATSILQLRQHPTGGYPDGFLRYQTYGSLEHRRDGVLQPLSASLRGLEQHQIRTLIDRHGRIREGPELAGSPSATPQLSAAALALSRIIELRLPDHPVAVGESWGDLVNWHTPPLDLAVIRIERRWTLVAIEGEGDERIAQIEWSAQLRLQPFDISNVSVEGQGHIVGVSELSMSDGVSVRTALDLNFEVGPMGVSEVFPLFHVEAKIRDRVEGNPGTARGELIQSIRPTNPRRGESPD